MTKPKLAKEPFTIQRRPGWGADIRVKIECNPTDSSWVKLGLAVRVAFNDGASLDGARLDGARLDGARLVGARLDGARLDGASLDGASLVGASLVGARLVGASLVGARLDGARLDGASLVGASLVGASLVGARLVGARLDGASLDGASLVGALIKDKKLKRLIAVVGRIEDAYIFNAFETDQGEVWISAGCRWFTPEQYIAHTATYSSETKRSETLAIIDFIEMRARALGIKLQETT